MSGWGGGEKDRKRETNCLGEDNPSYYTKAEVKILKKGFFLPNCIYIFMLLYSNFFKMIWKGKTVF